MRLVIWANKRAWTSAKKLADSLKVTLPNKVILVGSKNKKYKVKQSDYMINYGNSKIAFPILPVYNNIFNVEDAVNKLKTFQRLKEFGIPCVEYSTSIEDAASWINDGKLVVARTNLTGCSGEGIVLCDSIDSLVDAPLYTQYKPKKHEYRVHVFNTSVIDVSWKRKKKNANINHKIRNYSNGWVYCRKNLPENLDRLKTIAIETIRTMGLYFGAVDIIYNQKEDQYYVLEVNTAPGLCGTTLNSYTQSITKDILNENY